MEMSIYSVQRQIEKGAKFAEKIRSIKVSMYKSSEDAEKIKAALLTLDFSEDEIDDLYRYLSGSSECLQKELENKRVDIACW